MADQVNEEEYRMVNVQLATDVREALSILKDRYDVRNMTEALREFIRQHDADVLTDAQRIVQSRALAAEKRKGGN